MIRLHQVNKSYSIGKNKMHVLKGIDMHIRPGELVSIMGSSGSGKSTLLNILGLLDNYDSGEYRLNDMLMRDLSQTKAAQLRNKFLGFVFQSFNLLAFKNATENVALPLYYQKVSK
jgi:putative ABC transport system ATP-binding protein